MPSEGRFKVWWDEKEGIIRNRSQGEFEEADAVRQIAESRPGKVLVLNDLTEAGKASSGARKVYTELLKSEKIAKHALVGMRTLTRVTCPFW